MKLDNKKQVAIDITVKTTKLLYFYKVTAVKRYKDVKSLQFKIAIETDEFTIIFNENDIEFIELNPSYQE